MTAPAFIMTADFDHRLVRIGFSQVFWTHEHIGQFIAAYVETVAKLGVEIGRQKTIVDLRNAVLQSQETIASIQSILADPSSGTTALVAESPMARMQTKRLQVRPAVRMFTDIAAAETWLAQLPASSAA